MSDAPFLSNSTSETIRAAAAALKAGHLVAFPTETVYGLGADARNPSAVKKIYEVKGRPSDHPLIVHISSIKQLEKWAIDVPEYAISLAATFWPGPMTLILKRANIAKDFITGGQNTVGLRVPRNPIALGLIQEFERIADSAIAAPSANRFGQVSPTSTAHVKEELGRFLSERDFVLDGGDSVIGIESTIVDCTNVIPRILRPGFLTKEDIQLVLGTEEVNFADTTDIKFSGSFAKHYAPKCKIILNSEAVPGAGFLALSEIGTPSGMVRVGAPQNVEEYARLLYSSLRFADSINLDSLVVVEPPGTGIALAIRERLAKASNTDFVP